MADSAQRLLVTGGYDDTGGATVDRMIMIRVERIFGAELDIA